MGRRRRLSPEERRLWDQVAATAAPLHPAPVDTEPAAAEPLPEPASGPRRADASAPAPGPRMQPAPPAPPRVGTDLAPDPHAPIDRPHPHMDRRRFERLTRGRFEPEARLDLHGMTLEAAHAALSRFVLASHARDLRILLVITGKGRAPDAVAMVQRPGILRHSVPHWLAAPPLAGRILQVAPAHQRHGGGGAFYVYLRRRR